MLVFMKFVTNRSPMDGMEVRNDKTKPTETNDEFFDLMNV